MADNVSMRFRSLDVPALTAALPDLALGGTFLLAWVAPVPLASGVLAHLTLVMILEFIIVHSSAFAGGVMFGTASPRAKAAALLALGGFYTIFVGGFSLAFHTLWPLASFWLLTLNRMLGVLLGQAPAGDERAFVQCSWVASVLFYMAGAFLTLLLPLPRLGLTGAVLAHQNLMGSGMWVDQPHRLAAFGFLYFTAVGISELYGHRWIRVQQSVASPATKRRRAA